MSARSNNANLEAASEFDGLSQRVRQALIGEGDWGRVVAVCIEPGMGASTLIKSAADYWSSKGMKVEHLSLHGETSASACNALNAKASSVLSDKRAARRCVVVIEGLPSPDECDVEQQVASLQSMACGGCLVLLSLFPEAELLVEELRTATCIGADDVVRFYQRDRDDQTELLTNGIPTLVDALDLSRDEIRSFERKEQMPNEYRSALSLLVSSSIRPSLPREDCRVRLAMLLLGSGSADDVTTLSGRLDRDTWDWMERVAPLFGIDSFTDTFSCAGLSSLEGLQHCRMALRLACEQMPDVVASATILLASRGDIKRAALTCEMCRHEDAMSIACEWGVELICAGEDGLVAKALEYQAKQGLPETESSEMSALALSALVDPAARIKVRHLPPLGSYRGPSALRRRRRYTELLQACRDLDRGIDPGRVVFGRDDDDEVASALVDHLHARQLLFAGEFSAAHAFLVDNALRQRPTTLVGALLCDDYEIACTLIGESQSDDDRHSMSMASKVYDRMHCDRLRCYRRVLEKALLTLVARYTHEGFAAEISRAEKMGDQAIRAALLIVAAMADIRKRAYASAHVHALYVMDMVGGAASDYLVLSSRLLDGLVQSHLKDGSDLHALAYTTRPSPASDIALLASAGANMNGEPVRLRVLSSSIPPKNELWMLNVVLNDFNDDGLSPSFRTHVPKSWAALSRATIRRAERTLRARGAFSTLTQNTSQISAVSTRAIQAKAADKTSRRQQRLEIRVLGGMRVLFGTNDITSRLCRRRVKAYLLLLAALPEHELGAVELMDSLWPGIDLTAGRQRIYSANCELRKVLAGFGLKDEPILKTRGEAMIRLNPELVNIDVDAFEHAAKTMLSSTGDGELLLRLASEAISFYQGDVASSSYDSHGLLAKRRHELRELFVDVAVAGSRAALAEGWAPQAVQMAKAANGANEMREDVVSVLIRALLAAGRDADACEIYDGYARQLLAKEGRPPSQGIRRLIEEVYRSPHTGSVVFGHTEHHEDLLLA